MALIYIPHLNPLHFVPLNPSVSANYRSKHLENVPYIDTIKPWQTKRFYAQPWQFSDHIHLQLRSGIGPITFKLKDKDGITRLTQNFEQKQRDRYDATLFIYEIDVDLSLVTEEGYYEAFIEIGNPVVTSYVTSVPLFICENAKDSVLLEYKHSSFKEDVYFTTGFSPSLRLTGTCRYKSPASKDTLFEDQVLNQVLLDSVPYRIWELLLGGAAGIPDYLIDKVNRIFGCNTLLVDGRSFTKAEGAKWEEKSGGPTYPLRGWSIDLRETLNRYSQIYNETQTINGRYAIVINSDSKGFGNDTGGNMQQLIDVI